MSTITIIGAGSAVFARQLMTDILLIEGLDEGCFALVDIDAERLELAHGSPNDSFCYFESFKIKFVRVNNDFFQ